MLETDDLAQKHEFSCPTCASALRFSPTDKKLVCGHCGYSEDIPESANAGVQFEEQDFTKFVNNYVSADDIEVMQILSCTNCGALIEFQKSEHAKECYFCASPVVLEANRHIKPRGVLPYQLNEDSAREALGEWLGTLWFAPNKLKDMARKERRMKGVYLPYWTYDANTKSDYRGFRGRDYTERYQVTVNGKSETRTVIKTEWTSAWGNVERFFNDILIPASQSVPIEVQSGIKQWDISALEAYAPHFIAGFNAETYSTDVILGYEEAKIYMEKVILKDVERDIGGDRQRVSSVNTKINKITFRHILLPVWIGVYKFQGETYNILVNGQNGKVAGQRPYSELKIIFFIFVLIILGLIAAYFYKTEIMP